MGAIIPEKVRESDLSRQIMEAGLNRIYQGKVRDTYLLSEALNLLLLIATDRISIYDFVLPALVKDKGAILTAMTVFWLRKVLKDFQNHLVDFGTNMDDFLPMTLRGNSELQKRAMIVKRVEIVPVECVVRGYLTGSAWSDYQNDDGWVYGIRLPKGLHDGSRLPELIFTPTTKAETGHDLPLEVKEVVNRYGSWIRDLPLAIYEKASRFAASQGIIIADTKFEFSKELLADEVLTPDSSRFWLENDWQEAVEQRKSPPSYDKQVVREWGKTIKTPFGVPGINNLDAGNLDEIAFVHKQKVPKEVLTDMTNRGRDIFMLTTGYNLELFQERWMGVKN